MASNDLAVEMAVNGALQSDERKRLGSAEHEREHAAQMAELLEDSPAGELRLLDALREVLSKGDAAVNSWWRTKGTLPPVRSDAERLADALRHGTEPRRE